jgi:hypothetical protein
MDRMKSMNQIEDIWFQTRLPEDLIRRLRAEAELRGVKPAAILIDALNRVLTVKLEAAA